MFPFLSKRGRKFTASDVRDAFRTVFRNPLSSESVLPDIADFCHVNDPVDTGLSEFELGRWIGRQDVWLHIQDYTHLTTEEIYDLLRGKAVLRLVDTSGKAVLRLGDTNGVE